MAIATLAACYNNPNVFTGVVKIRKGQAVALMMESTNMTQLQLIMAQFAEEVYMLRDAYSFFFCPYKPFYQHTNVNMHMTHIDTQIYCLQSFFTNLNCL